MQLHKMDLTDDLIDGLEGLLPAMEVMKKHNLELKGVTTLDMAKNKLRLHQAMQTSSTEMARGPDAEVISRLVNMDSTRRETLLEHLEQVVSFVNGLPQERKKELHTAFPQMDSEVEGIRHQLQHEHCVILVAGETSAGKSSLLNLLLGETERNMLPVAHLSSTSVICELKYGDTRRGIAHPWPDDERGDAKYLNLDTEGADKVLSDHIYQKQERGKRFPYQRVEIFWPCEWLKNGLSIIDSPGVGESEEMTNLVKSYIPKAFGFIYVINCANAGGVQPDRLQDLLFTHFIETKKYQNEGWQFDPNSVIFVCNKWDLIKVPERPVVKTAIMNQLQECWAGFSEKQIFFFSTSQALDFFKNHNQVSSGYTQLLKGIEDLLPISLDQKITKHFRFISQILNKAASIIKTHITQLEISGLDSEEIVQKATERLQKVEEAPHLIKTEMRYQLELGIQHGISEVRKFLKTPEVIGRLISWHESECPSTDRLSLLEDLTISCAMKRIRMEINRWEKENRLFENIQNKIIAVFEEKFISVKLELKEIENSLMSKDRDAPYMSNRVYQTDEDYVGLNLKRKIIMGATAPIWIPVGLVVGMFALPAYGIKNALRRKKETKQLANYSKNKAKEMSRITNHILEEITESGKLKDLIEDKISACLALSGKLAAKIPNMIKADQLILKNLQTEMQHAGKVLDELKPLCNKSIQLQGQIDKYYMENIRTYDIVIDDIKKWDEEADLIGQGMFGIVFKTSMIVNGKKENIALKKGKVPLSEIGATEFLLEEYNLRKLQKPYIIRYIGTSLQKQEDRLYPIMVMEFCESSLENIIYDKERYSPPGDYTKLHRKPHLIKATEFADQLSQGLLAIHTAGFVHRDLKPANILMTSTGQLRLADLGMACEEKKITGSIKGTLVYMAPDVVFDGIYNRKIDIFSYGIILWELWYGKYITDVYQITNYESFLRNAFCEHTPDGVWKPMMSQCWLRDPDARPTITECSKRFGKYLHEISAV